MGTMFEDVEVGRRMTHALGGVPVAAFAVDAISWLVLGIVLWLMVGVVAVLEYARLRRGVSHMVYERLTRPYEADSVAGYAYYAVGLAVAWVALPPAAMVVGAAALCLGDPLSGIVSGSGDARWWRAASGVVMFCVVATATVLVFREMSVVTVGTLAVVAGSVAVVSDLYRFRVRGRIIDDNLLLPLVPPTALVLVQTILF